MRYLRRRPAIVIMTVVAIAACATQPTLRQQATTIVDHFRGCVQDAVADPERRAAADVITAAMEQAIVDDQQRLVEHRERMFELNADYDATRASFEEALVQFEAEKRALGGALVKDVLQLRDIMTAKEWQQAFDAMAEVREH